MAEKNLKEHLAQLLKLSQTQETISIKEILGVFSGKGRILLLLMLSLPFCQPISIPGLSTPFGLVIAFIGLRMLFGQHLWLPKRLLVKRISSITLQKIAQKSIQLVEKMRHFIRSRLCWLCENKGWHISNALLIVLLGILLALPLPIPFTNLPIGWALFLLSIGLLGDDGLFILASYFVSLFTIVFFVLLGFSIKHLF